MNLRTRPSLVRLMTAITALFVFALTTLVGPFAGNAAWAGQVHHRHLNAVQKHPTLTGIGAGVATHHLLKKSAAAKKRRHQKLNFAERHPTLSGIGAAVTTHHIIKKTTPH